MSIKEFRTVLINEAYFIKNSNLKKMLDFDNLKKQSNRNYLFVELMIRENRILVPLRSNLGEAKRKFGKIGFQVPSSKKPLAGLDYRYILIVNDEKHIEYQSILKIPKSQIKILKDNYNLIEEEVINYIEKYIKVANKNRVHRECLYRESSLQNFNRELGVKFIEQFIKEVAIDNED
ncbi:MAG: hypothetical protein ACRC30_00280 [Clostridium sp.]